MKFVTLHVLNELFLPALKCNIRHGIPQQQPPLCLNQVFKKTFIIFFTTLPIVFINMHIHKF